MNNRRAALLLVLGTFPAISTVLLLQGYDLERAVEIAGVICGLMAEIAHRLFTDGDDQALGGPSPLPA